MINQVQRYNKKMEYANKWEIFTQNCHFSQGMKENTRGALRVLRAWGLSWIYYQMVCYHRIFLPHFRGRKRPELMFASIEGVVLHPKVEHISEEEDRRSVLAHLIKKGKESF